MHSANRFGAGTGPVWLKNIKCKGHESSVEDCQGTDWKDQDCPHSLDVGVSCGYNLQDLQGTVKESRLLLSFFFVQFADIIDNIARV